MDDIKTPLVRLMPGDKYIAHGNDDSYIITPDHTHADILRYVVDDIGKDDVTAMLKAMYN